MTLRRRPAGRSESDLVDGSDGPALGGTLPRLPAASPAPPPYAPVSRHASLSRGGGGGGGGNRGSLPPPPLPPVTSLYSPVAERAGTAPPPAPPLGGCEPPPPPAAGLLGRLTQVGGASAHRTGCQSAGQRRSNLSRCKMGLLLTREALKKFSHFPNCGGTSCAVYCL